MNRIDAPRFVRLALVPATALALIAGAAHAKSERTPPPMPAPPAAESLLVSASRRLALDDHTQTQFALDELDRALMLAPRDPRVVLVAARANLDAGRLMRAREYFRRLAALTPDDARAFVGLGETARRGWLVVMDSTRFREALDALRTATERAPDVAEAWFRLAPLEYEAHQLKRAGLAAEHALALAPDDPQAALACAYLHYRGGHLGHADSLFADAIPRLSRALRARLEDLSPILSEADRDRWEELDEEERATFAEAYWRARDPDPTTRVNEARLEFRSRVAHVLLLMQKGSSVAWDIRAELYARYGSPDEVLRLPGGERLYSTMPAIAVRGGVAHELSVPGSVPTRSLLWERPDLGMSAYIEEAGMGTGYRRVPLAPPPRVDTRAIQRTDLVTEDEGQAVFSTLPPGATRLDVAGSAHRFAGDAGPHLFAFVTAPGTPADTLRAECVVATPAGREVARASRRLAPSACDPANARTGEFGFDLAPGDYRIAIAVSDGHGGRGVLRCTDSLEAAEPGALHVSDVVVVCRPPASAPTAGTIVLDPDPRAAPPPGIALAVYFEIRGLARDAEGASSFEISYVGTPLDRRLRPSGVQRLFGAHGRQFPLGRSTDRFVGDVRRQFLSIPLKGLPAGRWRLDVIVRDTVSGAEQARSVLFEKGWS